MSLCTIEINSEYNNNKKYVSIIKLAKKYIPYIQCKMYN